MKKFVLVALVAIVAIVSIVLYKEVSNVPSEWRENKKIDLSQTLSYYYIDFANNKYFRLLNNGVLDNHGVPIYRIKGQNFYHAVFISQFALGAYDVYLDTHDISAREKFLNCAESLRKNLKRHGKFLYWEYGFENAGYPGGLGIPWFSAMTQGQGASVLLRAYVETIDEKYLQAAKEAIESIFFDVSAGGVSIVRGSDYVFPQEYLTVQASDILNGAIYAYFGVYDYYRVTGDVRVKQLADTIAKSFLNKIKQYDTGYWSLYSLWPDGTLATGGYHSLHIAQLKMLYLITKEAEFLKYAVRFEGYQNNWKMRMEYVLARYLGQAQRMKSGDISKIPEFICKKLRLSFSWQGCRGAVSGSALCWLTH